jgi:hypothetical protein
VPAETSPGVPSDAIAHSTELPSLTAVAGAGTLLWRSAQCSTNSCLEVADLADGRVAIRNGNSGNDSSVLIFSGDEWRAFVTGVNAGEFD